MGVTRAVWRCRLRLMCYYYCRNATPAGGFCYANISGTTGGISFISRTLVHGRVTGADMCITKVQFSVGNHPENSSHGFKTNHPHIDTILFRVAPYILFFDMSRQKGAVSHGKSIDMVNVLK